MIGLEKMCVYQATIETLQMTGETVKICTEFYTFGLDIKNWKKTYKFRSQNLSRQGVKLMHLRDAD